MHVSVEEPGESEAERPAQSQAREILEQFSATFDSSEIDPDSARLLDEPGLPEPYRDVLAHAEHMTERLERRYRQEMQLEVLDVRDSKRGYARRLRMRAGSGGPIVLEGWMRVLLECLPVALRDGVRAGARPLGRMLIDAEVERRIDLLSFVAPGETRADWASREDRPALVGTYGRIATIEIEGQKAVDLVEFVAPAVASGT